MDRCGDCDYFEFCTDGSYYCHNRETSIVDPEDAACGSFDSASNREKREKEKEADRHWKHDY